MAHPTDQSRASEVNERRPAPKRKAGVPGADEQNTRSMRRLDADNRAGLDAADRAPDDPNQWPGL